MQSPSYEDLQKRVQALEQEISLLQLSEKGLIEQAQKYRGFLDRMAQGIFCQRPDGSLIDVNAAALDIFGLTKDEFIGRTSKDSRWKVIREDGSELPGDEHPSMVALVTGKPVCDFTAGIFNPIKNDYTWITINAIPLFHEKENTPYQVFVTVHDITQRRKMEEALRDSEEKHRLLFLHSQDVIYSIDPQLVLTTVSPSVETVLGYKPEELIGRPFPELNILAPESFEPAFSDTVKILSGESISSARYEFIAKDGSKKIGDVSGAPIFKDGKVISIISIARDITDSLAAEKALARTEQKWRNILVNTPQIGISLDPNARIIFVNDHFLKLTGWQAAEIMGKNWFDLFIPENIREEIRNVFHKVMNQKDMTEFSTYENEIITKTGKVRNIAWSNVLTQDARGSINDITCLGIDLTERKQMEAELQRNQRLKAIGTLAGGIAHDFNNILAAIIGFTELSLEDAEKGTPLTDYLQEIYSAGKRAKNLVKQILTFARQSDVEIRPVQIDKIGREVLKLMRATLPVTIDIQAHFDSTSLVMANSTHIHQVFMNLCTNAAHAMTETGGVMSVGLTDTDFDDIEAMIQTGLPPGNYIRLTVTDTGKGISADIIDSIFEPYFTTRDVGEGSGMGLAMIHGIVETYGGKIFVESAPDQGAVFTIYLPTTRKHEPSRQVDIQPIPTGNERILFVDDEVPITKMGKQILERLGYQVTIRNDSKKALDVFRSAPHEFDLVITDMTMPEMTGDILAVEMMKIRPDIPVILCTGYSNRISDETAAGFGIRAFAYKPLAKAELARTVRKVLDSEK